MTNKEPIQHSWLDFVRWIAWGIILGLIGWAMIVVIVLLIYKLGHAFVGAF